MIIGSIPNQAIPSSKKGKKFFEKTMDELEQIARIQVSDNAKFIDYYRMIDGKLSFKQMKEVLPQYRDVAGMLDSVEIDSIVKHYDIIGSIINKMTSLYDHISDGIKITSNDSLSNNEYMEEKNKMMTSYAKQELQKIISVKLAEEGLTPEAIQKLSPEQQQQLQQKVAELTPEGIEKTLKTSWSTVAATWAIHTYRKDRNRFNLDSLDLTQLVDFLLTGRCFRHHKIGYDSYTIERWNPIETFFSQSHDTEFIERGEYAGRLTLKTPSQVVTTYGHLLTRKQKEAILKSSSSTYSSSETKQMDISNLYSNGVPTQERAVPFKGYTTYDHLRTIQELTGEPIMESVDSEWNKFNSYLHGIFNGNNSIQPISPVLNRFDMKLRSDLIEVTEAYWVGYELKGLVTYRDPLGVLKSEMVTDSILNEFLEKNNIKEIRSYTLKQATDEPVENSILWDYLPIVYSGIKINPQNSKPLYIGIEPLPFQVRGNSNTFDVLLPVTGRIGESVGLKLENYQTSYNIVNNQIYNLLGKELGTFYLFDAQFLDTSNLEDGDAADALFNMRQDIVDNGIVPIRTHNSSLKDSFIPLNISYSQEIRDRINLSSYYKNQALEAIGLTPQAMMTPSEVTDANGNQLQNSMSFSQIDSYFEKYDEFIKNSIVLHINVAQYAQKNGKDLTVQYTTSTPENIYLEMSDENFHIRELDVTLTNSIKSRRKLDSFKNLVLSTNTLGNDTLALAEVVSSESMAEIIRVARETRLSAQKSAQAAAAQRNQHEMEVIKEQQKIALEKQNRDNATKIEIEKIRGSSRVAMRNAKAEFYSPENDITAAKIELENERLELDKQKAETDAELRQEKLKIQIAALQNRKLDREANKYIARKNKN